MNVIIPFNVIVVVLQLRDVPKTLIWVSQNGGHKQSLGGARPPWPPRSDGTVFPSSSVVLWLRDIFQKQFFFSKPKWGRALPSP